MIKKILSLPYTDYLIILSSLFFCYLGAKQYAPDNLALHGVNPHPYFIISVLIAGYYGLRIAFFSSVLFSALYMSLLHYQTDYQVVETLIDLKFLSFPLLLILTSVIIGELRQKVLDNISSSGKTLNDKSSQISQLQKKIDLLTRESLELKQRLISKVDTYNILLDSMKSLNTFDIDELLDNFIKVLKKELSVEKVAIYHYQENKNTLCLHSYYFSDGTTPAKTIDIRKEKPALIQNSLNTNGVTSLKDIFSHLEFNEKKGESLLVGPVFSEGVENIDRDPYAMVVIYDMPFLKYIPSNFSLFKILIDLLSFMIQKSQKYNRMSSYNVIDSELNIYKHSYFLDRISEEFEQAKTYMLPLVLIQVKIENLEKIDEKKLMSILVLISTTIKENIRKMDCVAKGEEPGKWFVLLPLTSEDKAEEVISNIHNTLESIQPPINDKGSRLILSHKKVTFGPEHETVQQFLDLL